MTAVGIAPEAEELLLAPTLATTFLGCRQAAAWDLEVRRKLREKPREPEQLVVLSRKGAEHERACREALKSTFGLVHDVSRQGSWEARVESTERAMQQGVPVIAQAALRASPWAGYADFLVRVEEPCARWPWSYEPWDAKLARTARPDHVLQLCFYGDMLDAIQGRAPTYGKLMLGGVPEVEPEDLCEEFHGRAVARFRLSDFRYYARRLARNLEAFAAAPPRTLEPEPCAACPTCRWRDDCETWWDDVDHLCRTADITRLQMRRLRAAGIHTMAELAALDDAVDLPRIAADTLDKLVCQARLQKRAYATGEGVCEILDCEPGRGFDRMPEPDPGDLFFDFEGDPLHPGGLEYLCGVLWREPGDSEDAPPRFRAFWAHDRESEKQAFSALIAFIAEHISRHPGAHLYHYASYERTAICRLASMHGVHEEDVDHLLRGGKLVDLYRVVREALRVGERSYSIKALERFYMEKRQTKVVSGGESIVVYDRWRQTGDDGLLRDIEAYNRDDCLSTLKLRDWLLQVRGPRQPAVEGVEGQKDEPEESPDAERQVAREAAAARQAELEARLLDCQPDEQGYRQCVADLVGFHRREEKPAWWAFFERHERSAHELIDDGECLGACEADGADWIGAVNRSKTYRYRFPEQETKLRPGSRVIAAGLKGEAGTILAIDEEERRVIVKRGASKEPLPRALSLIPPGPIEADTLKDAVRCVAEDIAMEGQRFPHIGALLRRESPRLAGREPGAPILEPEACADPACLLDAAKEAILALQESWLFVQGPPGAGKTFLSSHLILALLRAGKRVGVSSNSHKAIDNLLRAVEKRAEECGFTDWRGQNKCDGDWQGRWIEPVKKNEDIDKNAELLAGTAWLFARDELEGCRDVVFVDEAGQASLGHLVAMARAARCIVLVGDQMQLGQPIQGAHPRESGLSALEFLLGRDAVIAPERGIFLPLTWRMHPHLCRFVSEAVYDGRLAAEVGCAAQRLVLDGTLEALKATGLAFVPVAHEGNGQKSEEEAAAVKAIYENLLRQRVVDRHGLERPMCPDDVLVIAPYNMQVNLLRRVLGADARIGTVDKFQGQEAEVVLVSMATSGIEEVPRDISFLLSRNRLNVALSRARCLAVLFASPGLLDMPVRTVEEMRLVNILCWAQEYSGAEAAVQD